MITLLHSSKTMRSAQAGQAHHQEPLLLAKAQELDQYLKKLSPTRLAKLMKISPALAHKTHTLVADWNTLPDRQTPAIDSFLGDIYSGLQAAKLSPRDREYANQHLFIISGLYGLLRALDEIYPYRLELGYRPTSQRFNNLYKYWGSDIADQLPPNDPIVNLASAEYSRAVLPYIDPTRVISPRFLTMNAKGEPTFVVVHAKIARGAFAHWMVRHRVSRTEQLVDFDLIGYRYRPSLSAPSAPVYVCQNFGGIGLSVRLT